MGSSCRPGKVPIGAFSGGHGYCPVPRRQCVSESCLGSSDATLPGLVRTGQLVPGAPRLTATYSNQGPVRLAAISGTVGCIVGVLGGPADAQERVCWKLASSCGSNLDLLGPSIQRLLDNIRTMSDGNFDIRFNEPGAPVPALRVFDVVESRRSPVQARVRPHRVPRAIRQPAGDRLPQGVVGRPRAGCPSSESHKAGGRRHRSGVAPGAPWRERDTTQRRVARPERPMICEER